MGAVGKPGTVVYDAKAGTYTVTGGGENMWFATDAFHFVWKKASGDVTLAADVRFVGSGGNAHRKAALLIRQGLEPDAAYADAVVHGDGLTSIQYREERGGPTREIQSKVRGPLRLRIEKEGDYVSLSVAAEGEPLGSAGGSFKIRLAEPFLVGLGVCAHDNAVSETAVFSNVEITTGRAPSKGEPMLESTLETIAIDSKDRRVVHHVREHIEAPNWSRDGKELVFNSGGLLFALPVTGGTPRKIDTGFATRCNNDHGLSPDGTLLAISDQSQEDGRSLIYVLPATGGTPRRVTPLGPSYWHGWSPDGRTLAYCAERGGEYDVYTIPVEGGEETRLTTAPGLDDGPDYSADGQWIYFNSERTGTMQIWRVRTDGTEQEQLTVRRLQRLVPAPVAGREVGGLPLVREGRQGAPAEPGRDDPHDAGRRRPDPGAGQALRRPGHDQRAVVVARQHEPGVRELPAGAALTAEAHGRRRPRGDTRACARRRTAASPIVSSAGPWP